MTRILSYLSRFLELRLRAFVYALFALVGFQLGMFVHHEMTLHGITQLEQHFLKTVRESRQ